MKQLNHLESPGFQLSFSILGRIEGGETAFDESGRIEIRVELSVSSAGSKGVKLLQGIPVFLRKVAFSILGRIEGGETGGR